MKGEITYPNGVGAGLMKAHEQRYAEAQTVIAQQAETIARLREALEAQPCECFNTTLTKYQRNFMRSTCRKCAALVQS